MSSFDSSRISTQPPCASPSNRSCSACPRTLRSKLESRIAELAELYQRSEEPWLIGFSGGKDSSAVVKLVYSALLRVHRFKRRVIVAYCDTGVEIPTARREALRVLRRLAEEARVDGLPIVTRIAQPPLANRFFVKVIGRGYPTPTNKFRWCTDRRKRVAVAH